MRIACEKSGRLATSSEQLHRAPGLDVPPTMWSEQGLVFTPAGSTGNWRRFARQSHARTTAE
jgi:hypothetical protein